MLGPPRPALVFEEGPCSVLCVGQAPSDGSLAFWIEFPTGERVSMGEHASQAHWMADSSPGVAESEWRYLCSCWVQATPEPSHLGASNQRRFLAYKVETGPHGMG